MSAVERSASLWLDQAVGHHVEGDLDAAEAAALTAKIKAYVGVTWLLLNEAHERRADKALGYASWAEYVEAEYDMSRSYAYRLIAHAKAVYELAGMAGLSDVSPIGDIPEGKTRAIDIEEVAAEVERQAAALPADATDEDRAEVVRRSLAKQTTTRTTTETTETTFDPETAEILGEADGRGDGHHDADVDSSGSSPAVDAPAGGEPRPAPAPTPSEGESPAQPSKPKRTPLADTAQRAGWEFRKSVERLERLIEDDRFSANRDQVAARLRGHLTYAVEAVQGLLDALDNEPQEAR